MNLKQLTKTWMSLIVLILPLLGHSLTYQIPSDPHDNIVGKVYTVKAKNKDTLRKIARRYDMGVIEMQEANPRYKLDDRIPSGRKIIIPAMFILPPGPRDGIVVNLDEYRLYYYVHDKNEVVTFPLGIGKDGWNTPVFNGRIVKKKANPEWNVPKSVYDYNLKKGIILPKVFPPGPNNPLGQYALYSSMPGYLLHGTNRPNGVGARVSSGCLRLRPENIDQLFALVPVQEKIRVILLPDKVGFKNGKTYLEVHKALSGYDDIYETSLTPLVSMIMLNKTADTTIDWDHVYLISEQQNGIPQPIEDIR